MRFKRRYFCVEITFQKEASALDKIHMNKIKHTNLSETIHKSIEQLYGDYGMAVMMPSFSVIYFNSATNLAILRTARDLQKKFHVLLAYVQKLADFDVSIRTVHVSGSIKKCKEFMAVHCQQILLDLRRTVAERKALNHVDDSGAKIEVLEKLVDVCEVNDNQFNLK